MKLKNYNNLLELLIDQYKSQNKKKVLLTSLGEPKKEFNWGETISIISLFSNELSKIIQKGDRCLLLSENRPEWFISDMAIMLAGGITVPTYTTYTTNDYEFILNDCNPSIIIISNNEQFNKLKTVIDNFKIKKVFSFDKLENSENRKIFCLQDLIKLRNNQNDIKITCKLSRKDPACIIYTSGTQGNPKGVVLSHGGILSNCEGGYSLLKNIVKKDPRFLTWLPLSHSYEHTVQFVQLAVGAKIFYAESIDKLIQNMSDCSPHIMTEVPRFYQNLFQKINTTFSKAKGIKKKLLNNTILLGTKKFRREKMSIIEKLVNSILNILVRSKIKKQFGGSLKTFVSGGGALDAKVGTFLNSIGLPTLQGYGLTESSPVVSCNPIDDIRIETVGIPFQCNEVRIAEDGEILVKGENVMLGYWNNKKETDKVLKNGWLHTGDIGNFEKNYLRITDRKKDILITPGGDNISPVKVETALTSSNLIEQALVYGDNRPYLVALIVLNNEMKIKNNELNTELEKINKNLTKIEKIKKYFIVNEKFSIENGMITPTLKLKRYKIINKFKNQFEKLYKN